MNSLFEVETKHIFIQIYDDFFDVKTKSIFKKYCIDRRVYYKDIETLDFDYSELNGVSFMGCHFNIIGQERLELNFGMSKKDRVKLRTAFLMIKQIRTSIRMQEWQNQTIEK